MAPTSAAAVRLSEPDIRKVFGQTLVEIARANPDLLVVDCQTAKVTAAAVFAEALPERFVDLAIAEQNAVSFAAGLARFGFTPVLPLFGAFSSRRALDQISTQVAYARLNVKVCGLYAGLTSPNTGATHQITQDIAIMRSLPQMTVVEPADAAELRQALPAAVAHQGPVYFRLVRGDIGGPCERVSPPDLVFELGKGTLLRSGGDVTLVGSGLMVSRCMHAAEALALEGVEAEVINISTLKPLDNEMIVSSARRTGAVVTAENHSILGGLGGAVAELLGAEIPVPVQRVGIRDEFGTSGPLAEIFLEYGLTAEAVCAAAHAVIEARR